MQRKMLTKTSPDHVAFYVTAIDGAKTYLMAGPYACHDAAKAAVSPVRAMAAEQDGRAHFMAFGTMGHGADVTPLKTPLGPEWAGA